MHSEELQTTHMHLSFRTQDKRKNKCKKCPSNTLWSRRSWLKSVSIACYNATRNHTTYGRMHVDCTAASLHAGWEVVVNCSRDRVGRGAWRADWVILLWIMPKWHARLQWCLCSSEQQLCFSFSSFSVKFLTGICLSTCSGMAFVLSFRAWDTFGGSQALQYNYG